VSDTITLVQPDSLFAVLTVIQYPNGHNVTLHGVPDGSIEMEVFGGTVPYNYHWSNGYLTEDLHNIGAGTYTVLITDANGCTYDAAATLNEPFVLEMPTGYSPNGDGWNDYFVVHGVESYPDNNIEVYNRWGNIVYSKENYMNQWNGHNNNGDDLPDATYFVVLTINGGDITLKGYVDLRR
jgi:gliding motility-associated-like protein